MNRLIDHIGFLLLENDYLVVPDFGGFIVSKQDAYNHDDKIVAPHFEVSFNQALTHNDGLLAQLYARTQGVNLSEAERILKEDITLLKSQLSIEAKLKLGTLGYMSLNDEGTMVFSVDGETPFRRPELYGCEDLSLLSISRLQALREKEQQKLQGRSKLKRMIRYSVASAAAILLLLTISTPIGTENTDNQYASILSPPSLKSEVVDSSLQNNSDTDATEVADNKQDTVTLDDAEIVTQPQLAKAVATDSYYLIVGTVKTERAAQQLKDEFRAKGLSANILDGKVKRVYIASFSHKEEAHTYLNKFVAENPDAGAWIHHKKDSSATH